MEAWWPRYVDDHGGWSYSTIIMDVVEMVDVKGINFETGSDGCRWMTAQEAMAARMHPGLAASWNALLKL